MATKDSERETSEDELASSPPTKKRRGTRANFGSDYGTSKPIRRSARTSAPKKRGSTPLEGDEASYTPRKSTRIPGSKPSGKATSTRTGRRVKEDVFNEPDRLFGPQKSLLYRDDTDVMAIVRSQKAIEVLSTTEVGYPFLDTSKKNLQHYVEILKKEGAEGYHDSDWLNEAIVATEERNAGVYDEYLNAKFKEEWGSDENEFYTDSEDGKDIQKSDHDEDQGDNLEKNAGENRRGGTSDGEIRSKIDDQPAEVEEVNQEALMEE